MNFSNATSSSVHVLMANTLRLRHRRYRCCDFTTFISIQDREKSVFISSRKFKAYIFYLNMTYFFTKNWSIPLWHCIVFNNAQCNFRQQFVIRVWFGRIFKYLLHYFILFYLQCNGSDILVCIMLGAFIWPLCRLTSVHICYKIPRQMHFHFYTDSFIFYILQMLLNLCAGCTNMQQSAMYATYICKVICEP